MIKYIRSFVTGLFFGVLIAFILLKLKMSFTTISVIIGICSTLPIATNLDKLRLIGHNPKNTAETAIHIKAEIAKYLGVILGNTLFLIIIQCIVGA